MSRIAVLMLGLMFTLASLGVGISAADTDAVLREDDEGVVQVADDAGGDDTGTGNGGGTNTGSRDSRDTTRERSASRDRSRDRTGEPNRRDRSASRDRSADNTRDHSVGVTTND
jgi:hypothetical protein